MNDSIKTRLVPRNERPAAEAKTVYIDTQNIPIQPEPLTPAQGGTVLVPRPDARTIPTQEVKPAPAKEEQRTTLLKLSSHSAGAAAESTPAPAPAPAANSSEVGWVVGWIVAISGAMKGRAFALGAGQNIIGRDSSNRISLTEDNGISRKGHLVITYDPRRNRFSARPGTEGSGITDLNDELLEMPTTLKRGDILRLTEETSLRFIPMCDEQFSWS